jgi:hypothetical protein
MPDADIALPEMEKWVQDHGSSRLRKAALAGLLHTCQAIYREERITLERPGWSFLVDVQVKDIRNPSEVILDALLDARELWPTVDLVWLQPTELPGEAWLVDDFCGRRIGIAVDDFQATQFDGDR